MRYRDMDFIQNVLNGMASRRPRLDALRDSWYDLDAHYAALETRFWQLIHELWRGVTQGALKLQTPASLFFSIRIQRGGITTKRKHSLE